MVKKVKTAAAKDEIDLGIMSGATAQAPGAGELVASADTVTAMAASLGYDGQLSVGALEDEIRFYQRRTVEDCLELGKRLLILKELSPHGEFTKRLELLGFAKKTAQRFMQAAAKCAKSDNLSLLSSQVKNVSAFLELVTHDDDVLEDLSKMDDIDCLSASELRARVRMLEAEGSEESQKIRAQFSKLSTEHENVSREYNRLIRTKKPGESAYNPLTFEVRHESAALEYGSRIHVDALEVMLDRVLDVDYPAPPKERELRLHAIGLASASLLSRAEKLYTRMKDEIGDAMPIKPSGIYMLTADERSRLDASISMIDVIFHRKKGERVAERDADAPPKAGRPKGSKNKKNGGDDD